MSMTPQLHAGFLAVAAAAAIAFALVILARNPRSTPARLHAAYGAAVGWWFLCTALLATDNGLQLWGRLAHLSIGMLPGIIFHLNVATAGVSHAHKRTIRWHYGGSAAITVVCVAWPAFHQVPNEFSWGPYIAYSWIGILPVGALLLVFFEVLRIYRRELWRAEKGSILREKLLAFYQGNIIAALSMIDFLPAFGFEIYPFAYAVLTFMNAATLLGSVRYRLIEVTPELAAEQILEALPEAVIATDSQHVIRLVNHAATELFERPAIALVDAPLVDVVRAPALLTALTPSASAPAMVRDLSFEGQDGENFFMRVTDRVLLDQRGGPVARIWVLHDLTAQRAAEVEKEKFEGWVRKGQRLESLGVLAGGIAHDFNNLLTVTLGQADVARLRAGEGAAIDEQLAAIIGASHHAEDLTAQMLTYAGRSDASRSLIDLNAVTHEMGELLHVARSKKARLVFELAPGLPLVHADASQMSQVILNLVTNASDALEDAPGIITLRTGFYDASSARDQGLKSGESHVFVEVVDTGVGMDSQTKAHVFDPFYTTKFAGRGLGLATVFGIVVAHDGSIRVASELGLGSRFTVALPTAVGTPSHEQRFDSEPQDSVQLLTEQLPGGSGLALLVDDEAEVRAVLHHMLVKAGFEVLEATNGKQAVEVFRARRDEISIVVLDVTMPEMDGGEALSVMRAHSASVPIILMSGNPGAKSIDISADPHSWFLKKPFRSADLAARLHEAVGSSVETAEQ